jgi:hypothetical protein
MSDTTSPVEESGPTTVQELVAVVTRLDTSVRTHNESTKLKLIALERADRRRRFSIRMAFATIVADLVVTSVGLAVLHNQGLANHRIQESLRQNYTTSQQQAITRTRVLCPLYQVLLASAQDPVRVAALTTQEKKTFEANVRVIRDGYVTLGCQPPLPETPPTTG